MTRIDQIVINASPLISLFRSGQAGLLPILFNRVIVPEAVWEEVVSAHGDAAAIELPKQSWTIRESVLVSPRLVNWNLGRGESAVLSYALANPGVRAIIDDRDARRCAQV